MFQINNSFGDNCNGIIKPYCILQKQLLTVCFCYVLLLAVKDHFEECYYQGNGINLPVRLRWCFQMRLINASNIYHQNMTGYFIASLHNPCVFCQNDVLLDTFLIILIIKPYDNLKISVMIRYHYTPLNKFCFYLSVIV